MRGKRGAGNPRARQGHVYGSPKQKAGRRLIQKPSREWVASTIALRNPASVREADILNDPRLGDQVNEQAKAELIRFLQKRFGNAFVQKAVSLVEQQGGDIPERLRALQTETEAPSALQRVQLGDDTATTHSELAFLLSFHVDRMTDALADIPADAPVRTRLQRWITTTRGSIAGLEPLGEEPLPELAERAALANYQELQSIETEIFREPTLEMRRAVTILSQAHTSAQSAEAAVQDALRAAFLRGDENQIAQLHGMIDTTREVVLDVHAILRQAREGLAALRGRTAPPAVPFMQMLARTHQINAALTAVCTLASMQRPTSLQSALDEVDNMATLAGAASTLLGLAPHMGLYLALYLGPATNAVTRGLRSVISRHFHQFVEMRVAAGQLPEAELLEEEPGGANMFNFLCISMWAQNAGQVPHPSPVEEHLLSRRSELQAATGAPLPMSGRRLNVAGVRTYVFEHRDVIWAMHYGSLPVPLRARGEAMMRRRQAGS